MATNSFDTTPKQSPIRRASSHKRKHFSPFFWWKHYSKEGKKLVNGKNFCFWWNSFAFTSKHALEFLSSPRLHITSMNNKFSSLSPSSCRFLENIHLLINLKNLFRFYWFRKERSKKHSRGILWVCKAARRKFFAALMILYVFLSETLKLLLPNQSKNEKVMKLSCTHLGMFTQLFNASVN